MFGGHRGHVVHLTGAEVALLGGDDAVLTVSVQGVVHIGVSRGVTVLDVHQQLLKVRLHRQVYYG